MSTLMGIVCRLLAMRARGSVEMWACKLAEQLIMCYVWHFQSEYEVSYTKISFDMLLLLLKSASCAVVSNYRCLCKAWTLNAPEIVKELPP